MSGRANGQMINDKYAKRADEQMTNIKNEQNEKMVKKTKRANIRAK
jgi:hypothetical protein